MGYACPVCETPQRDAEHLANHLAFTAMLRDDGHGAWLDDHVPDWAERSPAELAPAVAEHVSETEYDAVFEDTVDRGDESAFGHDHDHDHGVDVPDRGERPHGVTDELDSETRAVLAEARELTRRMLDDDGTDGE